MNLITNIVQSRPTSTGIDWVSENLTYDNFYSLFESTSIAPLLKKEVVQYNAKAVVSNTALAYLVLSIAKIALLGGIFAIGSIIGAACSGYTYWNVSSNLGALGEKALPTSNSNDLKFGRGLFWKVIGLSEQNLTAFPRS